MKREVDKTYQEFINGEGLACRWTVEDGDLGASPLFDFFNLYDGSDSVFIDSADARAVLNELLAFVNTVEERDGENKTIEEVNDEIPF